MKPGRSIRRLLATLDRPAPRLRLSTRIGIALCLAALALDAIAAMFGSHSIFHFCPMRMRHYPTDADIPVIYGPLVSADADTVKRARRGEIVLRERMLVPAAAVCPFCGWPTRLYDPDFMPDPLDAEGALLPSLDDDEAAALRLHAHQLMRASRWDRRDRITAAVITEFDVWLGTWFSGLHRYDRQTRRWLSFQPPPDSRGGLRIPASHIYRIWSENSAVHIEHADLESPGYRRVHHTTDRGRSWHAGLAPMKPRPRE